MRLMQLVIVLWAGWTIMKIILAMAMTMVMRANNVIVGEVDYESDSFIKGESIIMFLHKLHSFVMLSCCRGLLWKKQLLDYICKSL
jgi:hypothetical protein